MTSETNNQINTKYSLVLNFNKYSLYLLQDVVAFAILHSFLSYIFRLKRPVTARFAI